MSAMPVSFAQGFAPDPVHLRHDLMIEIGRIDMALDDVRRRAPANQPDVVAIRTAPLWSVTQPVMLPGFSATMVAAPDFTLIL